jgi:hypothetical protein
MGFHLQGVQKELSQVKYYITSTITAKMNHSTECPTSYRTRHFFDNFTINEDIATKFEADLPHRVRNVTS